MINSAPGEAAAPRQADAGQSEQQEEAGEPDHAAHHAAELADVAGAGPALEERKHQEATTGSYPEIGQRHQRSVQCGKDEESNGTDN
ncbi:MAG TPA: hypothetical protein PK752_17335 [Accumulibacter sp.]|uniref:hypothetical protein n=1 Tax=Accumulibacter sp. TaxID=2053492 RepID=UPI002CDCC2C8|nr:hypothetical protein [Accumulibacter sp.]HRD90001.1 hypothetical protein [Accumulibacter sp.]